MRHLISQKNGAAGQDNTGLNAQMRLGDKVFLLTQEGLVYSYVLARIDYNSLLEFLCSQLLCASF